jgi:hypothetical protein
VKELEPYRGMDEDGGNDGVSKHGSSGANFVGKRLYYGGM